MPDSDAVADAGLTDRDDDLALMLGATQAAAALALDLFDRGGVAQWDKSPGHPVSAADLAVDALLKGELLGGRPDYGWRSEETAATMSSSAIDTEGLVRRAARRVWVVDPIDGTRDFIRGATGWAVSVALIDDGAVVLAALAAPARRQLFVATRGGGATLDGVPLAVSGRADLAGVRLPVDPPTLGATFWPEPWDAVAVEKPNSLALRIAHVARGIADGFVEGRTIAEWDIAAAALILTEAGGVVTDRHGATLTFNRPSPVVQGLVAATPALHDALRRRLDGGIRALAAARASRS